MKSIGKWTNMLRSLNTWSNHKALSTNLASQELIEALVAPM